MPRPSAGPRLRFASCPRAKRFTARPLRCERPWLAGPCCLSRRLISTARFPRRGRVIELVESHGKQLDIVWDDGLILHTNLFFGGAWHLYRTGERWRKPMSQLRVGITVDAFSAVCFGARTVETYREFDTHRHPGFGRTGPDLCASRPPISTPQSRRCASTRSRRADRRGAARPAGGLRSRQRVSQRDPVGLPATSVCAGVDARLAPTWNESSSTAVTVLHANLNPADADVDDRSRSWRSTVATVNGACGAATPSRSAVSASTPVCCIGAPAARCIVARDRADCSRRLAADGPASRGGEVPGRAALATAATTSPADRRHCAASRHRSGTARGGCRSPLSHPASSWVGWSKAGCGRPIRCW